MAGTKKKNCVNVYDIVLDRGTIGALLYANEIESKNIKLASNIDDIVFGLFKMSQVPAMPSISNVPHSSLPQISRPTQMPTNRGLGKGTQTITQKPTEPNLVQQHGAELGRGVSELGFTAKYLKYIQALLKSKQIEFLASKGNIDKLADIIAHVPQIGPAAGEGPFSTAGNIRQQLFDKAVTGLKPDQIDELLQKISIKQNQSSGFLTRLQNAKGALQGSSSSATNRPASFHAEFFDNLTPSDLTSKGINPSDLYNKTSEEVEALLKSKGVKAPVIKNYQNTVMNGVGNVEQNLGSDGQILNGRAGSILQMIADGDSVFAKPLKDLLQFCAENANTIEFLGKALGALGVAFEAYGIYDDVQKKEGLDSEVICKIVALIVDIMQVASVTSVVGIEIEPFLLPISLALHLGGCWLVGNIFGRKENVKDQKINPTQIEARAQTINASDLPASDLQKLKTLATEAIQNNSDFDDAVAQALSNKAFGHPLDAAALAHKYSEDPTAIPGVNPKNTENIKSSKFNYRKYNLAFNN